MSERQTAQPGALGGVAGTDEAPGPAANRALAGRIARRLYGVEPSLRWIRSDEVDVFVASFDGAAGVPHKVIKLDRPGRSVVAQEQRLLPYLLAGGIEVPAIEHMGMEPVEDVPDAAEAVAFNVQPFLERRGIGRIYAEDVNGARDIATRLGRSAARVHALRVSDVPGGQSARATLRWTKGFWIDRHKDYLESPLRSVRYDLACERALALMEGTPAHFGNGQGYQSLFDGRGSFAIVDWGTCGVYWRLYDLSMAVGAMDIWCRWEKLPEGARVTGAEVSDDLTPRVLAAYEAEWGGALTETERDELAVWRAHHGVMSAVQAVKRNQTEHAAARLACAEQALRERPAAVE